MRQFSVSSAVIVLLVCGAVASAGVVGTYAVVAPLMTGAAPKTSEVRIFVDDYLPVSVTKKAGGTLVPASQGGLSLVKEGNLIQEAPIGSGGTVQVSNLGYGPYSIFIDGPDGFAAFGTWIAPASDGFGTPGSGIEVALVPNEDLGVVRQIIDKHLQFGGPTVGQQDSEPTPASGFVHSDRGLDSTSEVSRNVLQPFENDGLSHVNTKASLLQGHGFEIRDDGTIVGKIVRSTAPSEPEPPVANLNVYFIQSGQIVGESRTDYDGLFSIAGLNAGVYSMVVAGSNAFLAMAAEVHPHAGSQSVTDIPFGGPALGEAESQTVSLLTKQPTVGQVSPVFSSDLSFLGDNIGPEGEPDGGFPFGPGGGGGGFGGGAGGGAAGGGGFAGGGGGIGALVGLGALGLGAAALADDDDNGGGVQVVSPAIP